MRSIGECPGVGEYGHGLTGKTVHWGCCAKSSGEASSGGDSVRYSSKPTEPCEVDAVYCTADTMRDQIKRLNRPYLVYSKVALPGPGRSVRPGIRIHSGGQSATGALPGWVVCYDDLTVELLDDDTFRVRFEA